MVEDGWWVVVVGGGGCVNGRDCCNQTAIKH